MCEKEIKLIVPAKDAPLLDVPSTPVKEGTKDNWWEDLDESC